jgi:hypothetical protein
VATRLPPKSVTADGRGRTQRHVVDGSSPNLKGLVPPERCFP